MLRNKSEAPTHIRRFLAGFTALLNEGRATPTRVVMGTLHGDNAGEFLSKQFTEFLADEGVTCQSGHLHFPRKSY
eukprot:2024087-Pleurochrysis_carterae.AAC.1